jgi:hypothetical protein
MALSVVAARRRDGVRFPIGQLNITDIIGRTGQMTKIFLFIGERPYSCQNQKRFLGATNIIGRTGQMTKIFLFIGERPYSCQNQKRFLGATIKDFDEKSFTD